MKLGIRIVSYALVLQLSFTSPCVVTMLCLIADSYYKKAVNLGTN